METQMVGEWMDLACTGRVVTDRNRPQPQGWWGDRVDTTASRRFSRRSTAGTLVSDDTWRSPPP